MALREGSRPEQEDGANQGVRQRRPDPGGVRADEVVLECLRLVTIDARRGEGTEPGGDAVDDVSRFDGCVDNGAGWLHPVREVWSGDRPCPAIGDLDYLARGEWPAIDDNLGHGEDGNGLIPDKPGEADTVPGT
jgi:hypothetical protein